MENSTYLKWLFGCLLLAILACQPTETTLIPLPTRLCVRVQHHHQPIPHAKVYIKYNSDTFPGYDKPPDFFDATFTTGADARGCLAPVPEGQHWVVAFGYDSLYFPNDVFGSQIVTISLNGAATVDTILYVSE